MKMHLPNISVVMPVYNGEKYLKEAIESILNQTYKDFEFIILNDGSTDKTEEIILSYDDPRIIYIKNEENLQIVKTLNKGIGFARGKYIARMDADDISLPERFEKQIGFMETNKDIKMCGTWVEVFGNDTKSIVYQYPSKHEDIHASMAFNEITFCHPTVMIERLSLLKLECIYNETANKAEDYELWTRLVDVIKVANITKVLLKYRVHNENTVSQFNDTQWELTQNIRLKVIEKLQFKLSENERNMHIHLTNFKYEKYEELEKWLVKLNDENNKTHYFKAEALTVLLRKKWFEICKVNTSQGMQILPIYLKSSFKEEKLLLGKNIASLIKSTILK